MDSLVHDTATLWHLVEMFGDRRIVLGSDYPFPLGEAVPGELIESLGLKQESKERLLWDNALEFLGQSAGVVLGASKAR